MSSSLPTAPRKPIPPLSIPQTTDTPTSTSSASTPTRKRKQGAFDSYKQVVLDVREMIEENKDVYSLEKALRMLLAGFDELDNTTPTKKPKPELPSMPASAINDVDHAVTLFGLEYSDSMLEYDWEVANSPEILLSMEAENLLQWMREAGFWKRNSCEALSRTFIDIVLFDRLRAHQEEVAARRLFLRGEYQLNARASAELQVFGIADYALGYDPLNPTKPKSFESFSILVEAKRGGSSTIYQGAPQVIAYMVAAQQHRLNLKTGRITNTIYGMVSDGIQWQFLRLDGKKLRISNQFRSIKKSDRNQIYHFIDRIIQASIASSPHTTPRRHFPRTQERWLEAVESKIFYPSSPSNQEKMPLERFMSADHDDEEDLNDNDYLKIQRLGGKIEFHPIQKKSSAQSL